MEQEEWEFVRQFIHKKKAGNWISFLGGVFSSPVLQSYNILQIFYSPAAQEAKNFSLLQSFFAIRCEQFLYRY